MTPNDEFPAHVFFSMKPSGLLSVDSSHNRLQRFFPSLLQTLLLSEGDSSHACCFRPRKSSPNAPAFFSVLTNPHEFCRSSRPFCISGFISFFPVGFLFLFPLLVTNLALDPPQYERLFLDHLFYFCFSLPLLHALWGSFFPVGGPA